MMVVMLGNAIVWHNVLVLVLIGILLGYQHSITSWTRSCHITVTSIGRMRTWRGQFPSHTAIDKASFVICFGIYMVSAVYYMRLRQMNVTLCLTLEQCWHGKYGNSQNVTGEANNMAFAYFTL